MNFRKTTFLFSFLALVLSCQIEAQSLYTYTKPETTDDGWKTNDLKTHVINPELINKMFIELKSEKHEIHSILVVKDEELILEEYFDTYSRNTQHDLRSVTKSIRSILAGIAIDKGYIESLDDPFLKYLKSHSPKKNKDHRKEEISIRDLMTMSTGLECNDWDRKSKGQEDRVYKKKDWIQYTLDLPVVNDPGEVSNYCSMGAILLAEIISQSSGMEIDEFAQVYLFKPLGIENVSWGHTSKKKIISSGKRVFMTPRDMAKIGQLILNEGNWKGKQIVSADWVNQSTTAKTKITNIDYGFLWWNIPFKYKDQIFSSVVGTGNGGQYIMILSDLNLIAVFTGGAYNSENDKIPFAIMNQILLPSLADGR